MDYTLCKSLKDAGFPQNTRSFWIKPLTHGTWVVADDMREDKTKLPDDVWKEYYACPSLEELIDACGWQLYELHHQAYKPWRVICEAGTVEGNTHIEAVANCWLSLHNTK